MKAIAFTVCIAALALLVVAIFEGVGPGHGPAGRIQAACDQQFGKGAAASTECAIDLTAQRLEALEASRMQAADRASR